MFGEISGLLEHGFIGVIAIIVLYTIFSLLCDAVAPPYLDNEEDDEDEERV